MKISYASDIHLEFGGFKISNLETDLIVLAGDISTINKSQILENLIVELSEFAPIVFVPGNHDYYNNQNGLNHAKYSLMNLEYHLNSLHLKNKVDICYKAKKLKINDIDFIGCTLWTDLNKNNPMDRRLSFQSMNDYGQINMTVDEWIIENNNHFNFIKENYNPNNKTVLITHHLPTEQAIGEFYKNDPLNFSFCNTKLDEILIDANEKLYCIHGHSHSQLDEYYQFNDNVRLLRNPRGYINYEPFAENWLGFKTIEI
jgi:predicted phosphodiesterase